MDRTSIDVFEKHFEEYDRWYERNRHVYVSEVEAIRKALPKGGIGIEIGVGTGRFASFLEIPFGIDPSLNMLKLARQRGVIVAAGVGELLPLRAGIFDYALIAITICFVKNPERVILETARILKTGGKIILGIIDRESFLGRKYQTKKSKFYEVARFFSVGEIVRMLESSGFEDFEFFQTIFDFLEKIDSPQRVETGYGKGGFVVISAEKVAR